MVRLSYEVFGRVQGVGFRMSTIHIADKLPEISGYVRNTEHRTVQGEVQGSPEIVQEFVRALEKGPAGKVEKVETAEIEEIPGDKGFKVAVSRMPEIPGDHEFRALDSSYYREHRRMLSHPGRCLQR